MLRSYARSAVRSLRRDPVPSAINVVGLAIAVAAAVTVYLFLQVYYTLDTGHVHGDRIWMVEHVVHRDGEAQTWGTAPAALGPALAAELPQVAAAVRVAWAGADVRTAAAAFPERVGFADPAFFDVFTFPLQAGTAAALATPGQAVLSAAAATRYFGDADPLGQSLSLAFEDGGPGQAVTVGAVAAPFPDNGSFRFDVLLPFDAQPAPPTPGDWAAFTNATFLLLHPGADAAAVTAALGRYTARQRAASPEWPVERWAMENLREPAPGAWRVRRRPTEAPEPAFTAMMVGMAALMLALASFNYVNIALGSAARRLREIGVRKVVGGTRGQLIGQFMAENVLLCALALALGVGLAWAFLVPLFNDVMVLQIGGPGSVGAPLWAFLGGLLLLLALVSGAYPALYVSAFRPAPILRGTVRLSERRWFTRALVTAQFVIVFLAVLASTVLLLNEAHLLGQPWGYRHQDAVAVRVADAAQFEAMRAAAAGLAGVEAVAGAQAHVGAGGGGVAYRLPGGEEAFEAMGYAVGPGYFAALGLERRAGRLFDADGAAADEVVVNERFAAARGWAEPVGQPLRLDDGRTYTVAGVVEDFLYDPIARPRPVLFQRAAPADYRYLVARVTPGRQAAVLDALEARWAARFPELPFDGFVQTEVFAGQLASFRRIARGVTYLAGLALLIACMGVFGLAAQNASRRLKEVSVRKVLGAGVPHLVYLVNRTFLGILAAAAAVATAAIYAGLRFLMGFDAVNMMPLTPLPFVVAYAVVALTVAASVAAQSRRLVRADPAAVLRAG